MLSYLEILLLALALSADAFTVGAAVGLCHHGARQIFRLSWHFGTFQSLMSLVGALAGGFLFRYARDLDHWIVLALLTFIGARMIVSSLRGEAPRIDCDRTKGASLVGLSLAVSIDALAAGVGLPAARTPVSVAVAVIGVVAGLATLAAMLLAERVSARVGRWGEAIAGLVLIGIGVRTVMEHTGLWPG